MIPARAHFVWFGRHFPWVYVLAVRSAALRGGFVEVRLHHADEIAPGPELDELRATPRVTLRRLDPCGLLEGLGPDGPALVPLYRRLKSPAARANMVRAALLAREGGVYLDTDTLTLNSFAPLLAAGVFCGAEYIALPGEVMRSRRPGTWIRAGMLLAARDLCRRAPRGWRAFRRIERFYHAAVSNAVLGAEPGHPFILDLLGRMIALPPREQLARYALGTNLLQTAVAQYQGRDLVVHPPRRFYPLPPEVSEHWFRHAAPAALNEILAPDTVVVHWYASVRTVRIVPAIDRDYIRKHADRQLFSALAKPFVS